jgi:osmoprotectant transport system substrate-binding protein
MSRYRTSISCHDTIHGSVAQHGIAARRPTRETTALLASDVIPLELDGAFLICRRRKDFMTGCAAAAVIALGVLGCGSASRPASSGATTGTKPAASRSPGAGKPPVTLGTKNFTEELILGQLYAQALRAKGFKVKLRSNLGDSEVVHREVYAGRIDGYPEYTGTILSVLAHDLRRPRSGAEAYARASRFERARGITLLAIAPAEDKDAVVAKPAYAAGHGLRSLGDLTHIRAAALAGPPEFRTRYDGLVGLKQSYGVSTLRFMPMKIGDQYRALDRGLAQLAVVFTTDGNLSEGRFKLLSDPRNIFGFQNVTFAIRSDVLRREGPAFGQTLNAVSAKLSTQALRVMNAAVDLDQQAPAAVARQFLAATGLT